jgi:hypothetical protein
MVKANSIGNCMKRSLTIYTLYVCTIAFLFGEFGIKWMLILTTALIIGFSVLRLRTLTAIKQEIKAHKGSLAFSLTCAIVMPIIVISSLEPDKPGALVLLFVLSPPATVCFYLWMRLIWVMRAKIKQRFEQLWQKK